MDLSEECIRIKQMTDVGTPSKHYFEILAETLDYRVEPIEEEDEWTVAIYDGTGTCPNVRYPLGQTFASAAEAGDAGMGYVARWKVIALDNLRILQGFGSGP